MSDSLISRIFWGVAEEKQTLFYQKNKNKTSTQHLRIGRNKHNLMQQKTGTTTLSLHFLQQHYHIFLWKCLDGNFNTIHTYEFILFLVTTRIGLHTWMLKNTSVFSFCLFKPPCLKYPVCSGRSPILIINYVQISSSCLNVNVLVLLTSSLRVIWISLGCGQNKTFKEEDIFEFRQHWKAFSHFFWYFIDQTTNRSIEKIINN